MVTTRNTTIQVNLKNPGTNQLTFSRAAGKLSLVLRPLMRLFNALAKRPLDGGDRSQCQCKKVLTRE